MNWMNFQSCFKILVSRFVDKIVTTLSTISFTTHGKEKLLMKRKNKFISKLKLSSE